MVRAWFLAGTLLLSASLEADEPVLDHQPVICSLPGKHARVCAYVADDGEVKRVRVYFRAEREDAFYWSDMVFDGIQYCATLPVPRGSVKGVEYYIWAVDDEFHSQRTRTHKISFVPQSPCEYPVFDEDPERTSNLVVHATSPKQGDSVKGFEDDGIRQLLTLERKKND